MFSYIIYCKYVFTLLIYLMDLQLLDNSKCLTKIHIQPAVLLYHLCLKALLVAKCYFKLLRPWQSQCLSKNYSISITVSSSPWLNSFSMTRLTQHAFSLVYDTTLGTVMGQMKTNTHSPSLRYFKELSYSLTIITEYLGSRRHWKALLEKQWSLKHNPEFTEVALSLGWKFKEPKSKICQAKKQVSQRVLEMLQEEEIIWNGEGFSRELMIVDWRMKPQKAV